MSALSSSVLTILLATALLASVFLYLYLRHRERSLFQWSVGWSCVAAGLAFRFAGTVGVAAPIAMLGDTIPSVCGAAFLLAGGYRFIGRRTPRVAYVALGLVVAWTVAAVALDLSFVWQSAPAFVGRGIVYIAMGVLLVTGGRGRLLGNRISGVALMLWGTHAMNYPVLAPVGWFAPIGHAITTALSFLVGIGLIIAYCDRLWARATASEQTFRAVVRSVDDVMAAVTPAGVISAVYGTWLARHGLSADCLLGRAVDAIVPADRRAEVAAARATALGGGVAEVMLHLSYGELERDLLFRVAPVRGDSGSVTGVVATGRDVTGFLETERALHAKLAENRVLLQEVHHRVKNNMQIMASLLNLQAMRLCNREDLPLFEESARRIETMASVHELLYNTNDLSHVPMRPFVHDLTTRLRDTYCDVLDSIDVRVDVDDVELILDQAVPCGQLMHEAVSNAFKHAFTDRSSGTVSVSLKESDEEALELRVSDDGVGISADPSPTATSLGIQLIELLGHQLGGAGGYTNGTGTTYTLRFRREATVRTLGGDPAVRV